MKRRFALHLLLDFAAGLVALVVLSIATLVGIASYTAISIPANLTEEISSFVPQLETVSYETFSFQVLPQDLAIVIDVYDLNIGANTEVNIPHIQIQRLQANLPLLSSLVGFVTPKHLWVENAAISYTQSPEPSTTDNAPATLTNNEVPSWLIYALENTQELLIKDSQLDVIIPKHDLRLRFPQIDATLVRDGLGILTGEAFLSLQADDSVFSLQAQASYDPSTDQFDLVTSTNDFVPADFHTVHPTFHLLSPLTTDIHSSLALRGTRHKGLETMRLTLSGQTEDLDLYSLADMGIPPLPTADFHADLSVDFQTSSMMIDHLTLETDDLFALVTGDVTPTNKTDTTTTYEATFTASADGLDVDRIPTYWPVGISTIAQNWIDERLEGGEITFATAKGLAKLVHTHSPKKAAQNDKEVKTSQNGMITGELLDLTGWFHAKGITVHYRPPALPAENVSGTAYFDTDVFIIEAQGGQLAETTLLGGPIDIIPHPAYDVPLMEMDLRIEGPLTDALTVLDSDPFNVLDGLGLPLDALSANAEARIGFGFPLDRAKILDTMTVDVAATLSDLRMTDAIPDWQASAETITLDVQRDAMIAQGALSLRPQAAPDTAIQSQLVWFEPFLPSAKAPRVIREKGLDAIVRGQETMRHMILVSPQLTATKITDAATHMMGNPDALSSFLTLSAPDGGDPILPLTLHLASQRSEKLAPNLPATQIAIKLDTTAATFGLPMLELESPATQKSSAVAVLGLDQDYTILGKQSADIRLTHVTDNTSSVTLDAQLDAREDLDDTALITGINLAVSGKNELDVTFNGHSDKRGTNQLAIKGRMLNLSHFLGGESETEPKSEADTDAEQEAAFLPTWLTQAPHEATIDLELVHLANDHSIYNVEADWHHNQKAFTALSLNALQRQQETQEDRPFIQASLVPKEDLPSPATHRLTLTAPSLGTVLQALGQSDSTRNGDLFIEIDFTPEMTHELSGRIKIRDINVKGLPVLARLLNAASPAGLIDLFNQQGLTFGRIDGQLTLPTDISRLSLSDVTFAGATIGLTAMGDIVLSHSPTQLDLRGTLIPVSPINKLVGSIPLIGQILGGVDGSGLVAMNYRIEGDASDPSVSVNPLSALTPGILRNIFFE